MKHVIRIYSAAFAMFALFMVGCSDLQDNSIVEPPPPVPSDFYTYKDNIQPFLALQCTGCHQGGSPLGSYKLTSYADLKGNGTDATPNLIPGDSTSLLFTKIKPGGSMNGQLGSDAAGAIDMFRKWIVRDSCLEKSTLSYNANMKSLFDADCISCHSGGSPSGNYNMTTYANITTSTGTDGTLNAIPGNASSLLITKVSGGSHFAWSSPADTIKINKLIRWVVNDSLAEN